MTKAISYPFVIDASGHIASTTDVRKIWQDRVRSVMNTQVGDRVMRPYFGINSEAALLNIGTPAGGELVTSIKNALVQQLPDLDVTDVQMSMDSTSAVLTVQVWFTLPNRQITSTTVSYDGGRVVSETNSEVVIP